MFERGRQSEYDTARQRHGQREEQDAEVEGGLKTAGLTRIEEARARDSTGYIVEPDRRGAIAIALRLARPGDVVVIAGKGHEDYQLVGNRVLKFDDRTVVRELASELGF